MGYNTYFSLEVDSNYEEVVDYLKVVDYGYYLSARLLEDPDSVDSMKWYHHDDDMEHLSQQFPDTLFTLQGVGEEYPDIWRKYYKNGKGYKVMAEITFPPFDPSKL